MVGVDTPFGPDGLPAVFEDGTWRSHDRIFSWNGTSWVPSPKASAAGHWLFRIGAGIVLVALLGYAIYTTVAANSEFAIGYYLGAVIFFAVLFATYRYAGRWGWIGVVVRAGCFLLAALKILTLIAHHPGA
jgi:hypothetical protein